MFVKAFWPSIVWSIVIVFLSSANGSTVPSAPWMQTLMIDKWVHTFMYFLLYVLIERGFNNYNIKYKIILNFTICISFGILMEIFQHYFWVNRSGDIFDVLANTFGVVLGIFFTELWLKKLYQKQE